MFVVLVKSMRVQNTSSVSLGHAPLSLLYVYVKTFFFFLHLE